MQRNLLKNFIWTATFTSLVLTAGISSAADIYLQAESFDKQIPDGNGGFIPIPMWGFAVCDDSSFAVCGNAQALDAPGPMIEQLAGDELNIHLNNTLPVPVSIAIPGQIEASAGDVVRFTDDRLRQRLQSFSHEAPPNGTADYTWSNLRAGTYLYQSGTYPSIQVPMGLYGALVVREAVGVPYSGVTTNSDAALLFSEIDPLQNQRAQSAATASLFLASAACTSLAEYAQNPVPGMPCTVDYNPVFFLVNGEPTADLPAAASGNNVLLRFLNAGLRSHTPAITGVELGLIAEDGNLYPGEPRNQSAVLLAAGKTLDALVNLPADNITFSIFDRMPSFSNENLPNGGSLGSWQIGTGTPIVPDNANPAMDDTYNVIEDTMLDTGIASVLDNDGGLTNAVAVGGPANGVLVLAVDGTFTYTPNLNFSGLDSFTYSASDGIDSFVAQASLDVSFANDAPVAMDDGPYVNRIGSAITVDAAHGVLGNDRDPDGDPLTVALVAPVPGGLVLNQDGSFVYSGGTSPLTFQYSISDGNLSSSASVSLRLNPVANIALEVKGPDTTPITDYRWTVEEDTMWQPDPNVPPPLDTLASNFHKSYMPIVAQGNGPVEFTQVALDPLKHYFVSVLPGDAASGSGHTIGGARIPPGATAVTVNVNDQPLPTAQISIFVFEDSSPTNGAVDGAETGAGLGGFQITLEDAGGRYGISGGTMSQDAFGEPLENALDCFGTTLPAPGVILTCPDTPENQAAELVGEVLIKNLYPGKYGVIATAPPGPDNWVQTSTIEGTKVIDAWVNAGEPAFFQEFGPAGWHAFVGFINPANLTIPAGEGITGSHTVTGKVTNMRISRPPIQTLFDSETNDALAHTTAWVGLNSAGGTGANIAAVKAADDGSFSIAGVPDGNYQLVVWDVYLDQVLAYRSVTLPNAEMGGSLGTVPVFQWFTRTEHNVFLDDGCGDPVFAGDGIRQDCEAPVQEQNINLRWRDGTVNQSFPTDAEGFVPFDETFPFFHWQVLEVDYTRFKPTGLTVIVDGGGDVRTTGNVLSPQQQGPCNQDDVDSGANGCTQVGAAYTSPGQRTELGPVLTEGFQGFLGQTSIFDWGKAPYSPGENGGISGIVYYASTRAENDPRLSVGEPWEPGVAGVKVRLYREVTTQLGATALVLVDETETDSWDNSLPSGCPGADATDAVITGGPVDKCYDGLRNFNQARPAVFDGGYAFMDISPGKYVVEMVTPPGYTLLKEEDNNVAFGDTYQSNAPVALALPGGALVPAIPDAAMVVAAQAPEPGLAQPRCVGEVRQVPATLSLFPGELVEAPFASADRPLCDRKVVILSDQGQAAADFFLFTGAPIAGHFAGMVLDDLAQEFNIYSPQFGEKWAPPYVPVSVRDYKGKEISRLYSDQWGRINGLVPSTFTANMPSPSGYSPAMLMTCMNDPGPIPDPNNPGQTIVDPQYNPAYSNFCYTFQYMPGATTYLDTPVLPVSAFASGYNPPSCEFDAGTPEIREVNGTGAGPLVAKRGTLTIVAQGDTRVPNPAYEGPLGPEPKTILRDFGFGDNEGYVSLDGIELSISSWSAAEIVATLPANASTGELIVTRSDSGNSTTNGITVTVSNETPLRVPSTYATIQAAIDAADPGALILVEPGSYDELIIMWKPVRLQGTGAGSTIINAAKRPTATVADWRTKMDCLFGIGAGCTQVVNPLPLQPDGAAGFDTEEGAAITVVGVFDSGTGPIPATGFRKFDSRIDGFSITGGDIGGGIFVNGYAHNLEIANNHVFGNSGLYHGGIRIGRPFVELTEEGPFAFNTDVNIHHNVINQNGGLGGAGGGLSIATGTDNYAVTNNFICGNFTTGDGGGIGHLGLSEQGQITSNRIVFNQSFTQAITRSGGGLLIAGEPPIVDGLSHGAGSVTVDANLIQGNHAGAGHGGGIRTQFVNGRDIVNSTNPNSGRAIPTQWYSITLSNNMIVNNVAGWSGGGVSMQDTARSFVVNNTIAHNDSTATVGGLIVANSSAPQPAGLSSEAHSAGLNAAIPSQNDTIGYRNFSNPKLLNNILWQNRAFHYDATGVSAGLIPQLSQSLVGECVSGAVYDDLGVLGGISNLNPVSSILTDTSGYDTSNIMADPGLQDAYCNGGRALAGQPGPMMALPALDEGGAAWVDVRFGPLVMTGDYHVLATSIAIDAGSSAGAPGSDYDLEHRPFGDYIDIGADEAYPASGGTAAPPQNPNPGNGNGNGGN